MPSLERAFSAVDRAYRPRDFQYKNPARKIGGPEGDRKGTNGVSTSEFTVPSCFRPWEANGVTANFMLF